jgi:hypothetical protein
LKDLQAKQLRETLALTVSSAEVNADGSIVAPTSDADLPDLLTSTEGDDETPCFNNACR